MLRRPGVKLHDPHGGAPAPGPLCSRTWEGERETVACRASSRRLQITERAGMWRRLIVARVDVGAQVVATDAGRGLDCQDVLWRKRLNFRHPLPNRCLRNIEQACEGGLGAYPLDRLPQRDNWR